MVSTSRTARIPLPGGYEWQRFGAWHAALRSDLRDVLSRVGLDDPDSLSRAEAVSYRGRGRPVRVSLGDGGAAVLRKYLHGGFLGGISGNRFLLRPPRSVRELRATVTARRGGARVPEVLAALHRDGRVFHEGFLLTREVEGAETLDAVIREGRAAGPLLLDLGVQVRKMHEAGVWHADLHARNVLVRGREVIVIDFDRARVLDPVPEALRERSLLRFDRSLVKLGLAGDRISGAARLRLLTGHYGGRLERTRLAGIVKRCRRRLRWHRWWWGLTRWRVGREA